MKSIVSGAARAAVAALLLASTADANTLFFQMNPNFDSGGTRQVFIFGAANTTGSVIGAGGFNQAFDLGAEGFAVVTLPTNQELSSNVIQDRGFRVESSQAVSGYFLNRRPQSTDMTYLIDGDALGTDYFTLGYANIQADQISVQATQDNTVVNFAPKGATPFQITLNAGQTYMYTTTAGVQLTGSRVTSDKPIAVFSGNRCTNVPTNVTACDHIVEQMPSTNVLSTTYLLAQTPRTGTQGNVVRVVATQDNTEVRFNGNLVATLNAGDFHEGRIVGGVELVATRPVLVGQYKIGQSQAGANTDPAMTIVPGQDQWLSSYVFAAPSGTANFPTDFVSIIINTNDLASLFVNGVQVDANLFQPLATTAFSYGNVDVSGVSGPFSITAASPFQLLLSGFDNFDSYFTYGGAAFSPGASPPPEEPPPPPPSPTGNVWWDGDAPGNANNNVVDGGDGVLTRTSGNLTTADGATNNALPVEPANIIFAGAPGTVEVDTSEGIITVAGLEFRVDGYRITGDSLVLAPTGATLRVGDGTPAGADFEAVVEAELVGAGRLTKTDLGTLVLAGANGYAGGTTVAAGTLIGAADSFGAGDASVAGEAVLVFDQAAAGSFGAAIDGAGALVKRGAGVLELSGSNGLSGSTTVEAGRLDVTGTLADSPVTVLAGATLGGTGTVGDTALEGGSRIAPGLSIGTLTVDGDIAFGAGSTYEVELLSTGESDRIAASGAATIASGATLQVVKLDAPRFVLGTRYTVLTAAEGRTGTFALSGPLRVSQFISVVGEYDAGNAYLAVRQTSSFASAGVTPNQIAAAGGADNAGNGAMYLGIAYLPDAASAQAAFDRISGEIHASARGIALEDSRFIREAVASRLLATQEEGMALWVNAYGAKGNWDGDGNAADISRKIGGVFLGADFIATSGVRAGILGGFGTGEIRLPARASTADITDFHLGGYGAFGLGPGINLHVGVGHMWRNVESMRSVVFPGFSDDLRAKYNLGVTQVFGDIGYRLDVGAVGLEPFASLAWVKVNDSSFRESGGTAALRATGNDSTDYIVTNLGGRAYAGLPVGAGNFGVMGSLAWRHVGGDARTTPLAMQFAAGGPFTIAGVPIARNAAALGFAVQAQVGRLELDVGYSGQVGGGVSDHGGRATAIFRF